MCTVTQISFFISAEFSIFPNLMSYTAGAFYKSWAEQQMFHGRL